MACRLSSCQACRGCQESIVFWWPSVAGHDCSMLRDRECSILQMTAACCEIENAASCSHGCPQPETCRAGKALSPDVWACAATGATQWSWRR